MKILGIIPARYDSSRFPGKPLVDIRGKSMIHRVYEQCQASKLLSEVIVATDDVRIFEHVKAFGGAVQMTNPNHPSGTDRCAEVASALDADVIVNIQGDEPFIDPKQIDLAIRPFIENDGIEITTLVKQINDTKSIFNSNVVKCVFNKKQQAMYFSRATLPYARERGVESGWTNKFDFYKHIGLYAFKKDTLMELCALAPSRLEETEKLEQLRWLEHGYSIHVVETDLETIGIDTSEDLDSVVAYYFDKN